MHFKIVLAVLLMLGTVAIQIEATIWVLRLARRPAGAILSMIRRSHVYRLGGIVLLMLTGHMLQMLLWAVAYRAVGAIEDFEKAMYFSMVTFTTLGYGDVTLDKETP